MPLTLLMFSPDWIAPWVCLGAVVSWILGARRLAGWLAGLGLGSIILIPLLDPLLAMVPLPLLIISLPVLALLLIHQVLAGVFGQGPADHFTGTWLVRVGDFILTAPFRLLRRVLRSLLP